MEDRLLDNPRIFAAAVARALDGVAIDSSGLSGFASSDFDAFLNHVFAREGVAPSRAVESLAGKPGFVWLAEAPTPDEVDSLGTLAVMHGMTATTSASTSRAPNAAEIVEVRSHADLDGWHAVYSETLVRARGRGLASALIEACHAVARTRGIDDALLQATDSGFRVYARAGYREERLLPVLRVALVD